jgi:hypothetical protein
MLTVPWALISHPSATAATGGAVGPEALPPVWRANLYRTDKAAGQVSQVGQGGTAVLRCHWLLTCHHPGINLT